MTSPMLPFMIGLNIIDEACVAPRDVLMMWAIRAEPGLMGKELARKIGKSERAHIQENAKRLIRYGMIEDRRPQNLNPSSNRRVPNDFHITQKGSDFLDSLFPEWRQT